MEKDTTYCNYITGSDELVNKLVEDHHGWAASIARSVARSWSLDWQLDGLDGGAYEGLLFCARRYDPNMGVPFRAYARRRIHESTTQQARESKSWQRGVGMGSEVDQDAREISARLFEIYHELREGFLPSTSDTDNEDGESSVRASIRQLLSSANLVSSFYESTSQNPEFSIEFKRMLVVIAEMDIVHQFILWNIYWQGQSMRSLATEWNIDELAIIREHQAILQFVQSRLSNPRSRTIKQLKIRPGLRQVAQKFRKSSNTPPFARFSQTAALAVLLTLLFRLPLFIIH